MSINNTIKPIVPDMSEFDINNVVSVIMGGTPDSEIQIGYEDDGSED